MLTLILSNRPAPPRLLCRYLALTTWERCLGKGPQRKRRPITGREAQLLTGKCKAATVGKVLKRHLTIEKPRNGKATRSNLVRQWENIPMKEWVRVKWVQSVVGNDLAGLTTRLTSKLNP